MPDLDAVLGKAVHLSAVALRAFAGTLAIFFCVGALLAVAAYYVLRGQPVYAGIAASVALAEALAAGVLLGGKRALVEALLHALRALRPGQQAVSIIFERLFGVAPGQEFGQRGGTLARAAERIPLAQAEQRLTHAVNELIRRPTSEGWFQRKVREILLRAVEKCTLARFREVGSQEGGVDLTMVQAALESRIDDELRDRLRAGMNLWTVATILGLPSLVFAQTYVILALIGR